MGLMNQPVITQMLEELVQILVPPIMPLKNPYSLQRKKSLERMSTMEMTPRVMERKLKREKILLKILLQRKKRTEKDVLLLTTRMTWM